MNINIIYTLISFLSWIYPSEKGPLPIEINNKLANYSWSYPNEKIYIHTDKSFYNTGEDIWFKVYLMIGPYHIPDTLSSVLYVELIREDETIMDRKIIHMREGLGWGDFTLPVTIRPGKYLIKAYTRYMQNFDPAFFFRKWIPVIPDVQKEENREENKQNLSASVLNNSDQSPVRIHFFPEGGDLVEGLQNYVAFKATDSFGSGLNVKGVIKNLKGVTLAEFESQKFGLGKFTLKPEEGEEYIASIIAEDGEYEYKIPSAKKKGYVMHINPKGNKVFIWVRNNMGIPLNNSFIIGQFRGFPFITIHAKPKQDYLYSILNTDEIPSGIIHFTFFDSLGIPQCERLVYTENENERITFMMESDKKIYKKREKTLFNIHSEDLDGNPVLTNLSLSVINSTLVEKDSNRSHIKSYFNLESDLTGTIENPGYYFNPENEDRHELMDILMLTHGWRRFVWKEVLEDRIPDLEFPVEAGFNVEGELVDFYNREKNQPGNLRLFIYENQLYYNEIETDENGRFQFRGLDIYDSTHVVMQAWRRQEMDEKRNKKKLPKPKDDLAIKIHTFAFADVSQDYWPSYLKKEGDLSDYLELNKFILKLDSSFDERTILMEELTIEDSKIEPEDPFNRPGKLYDNPSRRINMDSLEAYYQGLLLFDIIRQYFPGVSIRGVPPELEITIRGPRSMSGDNQPVLLLDGNTVESDFMYYFPSSEIAFIDLLNASKAAIYGSEAANGVIAFYTRQESTDRPERERMGMINYIHHGYYRAREFYTPDYDRPEEKHIKPDYRRTLYWNPSLTTDELGNIEFSFFTSDESATYRIEIEGMTYSGIPFTSEYYFTVE